MSWFRQICGSALFSGVLLLAGSGHLDARLDRNAAPGIMPDKHVLRSGDLVFRRGEGIVSDMAVRFSNTDHRYSHVGVLVTDGAELSVAHSVVDDQKDYDGVVVETLDSFLRGVEEWAIYRLWPDGPSISAEYVRAHYAGVTFDSEFDLDTRSRMYCTEFVADLINTVSGQMRVTAGSMRLGRRYIAVDELYRNDSAERVSDSARTMQSVSRSRKPAFFN